MSSVFTYPDDEYGLVPEEVLLALSAVWGDK
jgi:hypothetical protein